MGSISDFLEDEFMDHILGIGTRNFSPVAPLFLGLSVGDPLDDASGVDESAGLADTYVRLQISFGAASGRSITQDALLTFATATATWGTISHWFICDHVSNTTFGTNVNMYASGALDSSKLVSAGNTPTIASGQTIIVVDTGKMTTWLATQFLDWAFDGGTLTPPSNIYLALCEVAADDDSTGVNIDEFEMTDYLRENHNTWDVSSGGATANTGIVDFGVLTGTGETVEALVLTDNSAKGAGNALFYDNTVSQAIGTGDSVNYPAGDIDASIS